MLNTDTQQIARTIDAAIRDSGRSIKEISDMTGISLPSLYRTRRGLRCPRINELAAISEAVGQDLIRLVHAHGSAA